MKNWFTSASAPKVITTDELPRRQMLRGLGAAAIGLPFLEAMGPTMGQRALAMTAADEPPKRTVIIAAGLGFHTPYLFPDSPGKLSASTPYLNKIKDHLNDVTLLSGLSHPEQQGNNGHASELTFLTSAQRPGLAGFRNSISLDQKIAAQIGIETRFPFLAVSTRGSSSLSWTASGVAIPGESSVEKLFKSMFIDGTESEIEQEMQRLRRGRSILDTIGLRAKMMEQQISTRDRHKLDEYLTSVRDLEQRLQQSEGWIKRPKPNIDAQPPQDIRDQNAAIERQRLLYDIIVKAIQTDSTRTITYALGGLNAVPDVPRCTERLAWTFSSRKRPREDRRIETNRRSRV